MKVTAVIITALLFVPSTAAQDRNALLQQAGEAWFTAERLHEELKAQPAAGRSRADYLRIVNAYQRVYLITPHTGYADDALIRIAGLYEEIQETQSAIRTLNFLVREYPSTPFRRQAADDLARLSGSAPERSTSGVVENVRYWESPGSVRVVVDLSGDVTVTQGEAHDPERVFMDISPARLNRSLAGSQWAVDSPILHRIRAGQFDTTTVRVVFDVGSMTRATVFKLRDPHRLIVDVFGDGPITARPAPPTAPVAAAEAARPPSPLLRAAGAAAAVPDATEPSAMDIRTFTPARPTDQGDLSLIRSLGLKISRVVIDPGHGGHDTGSIGPTGYMEKDLVLDVGLRLKELIQTELAAEVIMTRNDDSYVPLEARTAKANQTAADLFISIHANSSNTQSVRGFETFILNFTTSREALETATRENAAAGSSIHELQDLATKIMLRDKVEESRELAQHLQRAMAQRSDGGPDRGVKEAPFVVLIGANMPSVLAEVAFISNPQDERLIRMPEYRQAIAQALLEGVKSYTDSLSGLITARSQEKAQD